MQLVRASLFFRATKCTLTCISPSPLGRGSGRGRECQGLLATPLIPSPSPKGRREFPATSGRGCECRGLQATPLIPQPFAQREKSFSATRIHLTRGRQRLESPAIVSAIRNAKVRVAMFYGRRSVSGFEAPRKMTGAGNSYRGCDLSHGEKTGLQVLSRLLQPHQSQVTQW